MDGIDDSSKLIIAYVDDSTLLTIAYLRAIVMKKLEVLYCHVETKCVTTFT